MPPVSQSQVTNSANSTGAIPSTVSTFNTQVSNTVTGVTSPNTNTTTGAVDYTQRQSALTSSDPQGRRKVALVGRYGGTGTTNTFGDATQASAMGGTPQFSTVIFPTTPQLSEAGSMLAVDIGEIRSAGSVIVYLGSPARVFSISSKFVSRTVTEATNTMKSINLIKAWRMPVSNRDEPETLRLFAYENALKGIPCLLTNYSIEWPEDVDYIQASDGTNVPIVMTINISLKEVRNFEDIQKFDYVQFKQGTLDQW